VTALCDRLPERPWSLLLRRLEFQTHLDAFLCNLL